MGYFRNLAARAGKRMQTTYNANVVADGHRVAIVVSRFNELIGRQLLEGALDAIARHSTGEVDVDVYWVPGTFELPGAVSRIVEAGGHTVVIPLGCLIRGGTDHYDLLATEVAKGLAKVAAQGKVGISFGIVTADTLEDALERAGAKGGNKGYQAAVAAVEMANFYRGIASPSAKRGGKK